jgi:hypothetical protein
MWSLEDRQQRLHQCRSYIVAAELLPLTTQASQHLAKSVLAIFMVRLTAFLFHTHFLQALQIPR